MALDPQHIRALSEAIDKIAKDAGVDPKFKELVGKLRSIEDELGGAKESDPNEPERDSDADDYSFDAAEKRHVARTAELRDGSAVAAGGEGK